MIMTLNVYPIKALKDNYIWAIVNSDKNCVIVDPGEALPVIHFLNQNNLTLSAILITHKHADHCHGVGEIIENFLSPVFGPYLKNGDKPPLPQFGQIFEVISIPGHTLEHIAFYGKGLLFCGDTLFTGGCGKVFEGTMEQMYHSLSQLTALPDDTLVYCGHEYTASNLKFAKQVEPNNQNLLKRIASIEKLILENIPTVPSTLEEEKKTNPFLRCSENEIIKSIENHFQIKTKSPVEIFSYLRQWKNDFGLTSIKRVI
jgi:hydroxyacylglutathione hydrolase